VLLSFDIFLTRRHPPFAAVLATANARVASLEVDLKASQKAYDVATTARASAEKSQKSALAKAKKAEQALADANHYRAQREQAMAERLHTMSATAESKRLVLSSTFDLRCTAELFIDTCLFPLSIHFMLCRSYREVSVFPANG
jgi:neutral trehalase